MSLVASLIDRVLEGDSPRDVVDELTTAAHMAKYPRPTGVVKSKRDQQESVPQATGPNPPEDWPTQWRDAWKKTNSSSNKRESSAERDNELSTRIAGSRRVDPSPSWPWPSRQRRETEFSEASGWAATKFNTIDAAIKAMKSALKNFKLVKQSRNYARFQSTFGPQKEFLLQGEVTPGATVYYTKHQVVGKSTQVVYTRSLAAGESPLQ
jgi:hypothetical protein